MNEQGGELGQPALAELLVEFPYGYIAGSESTTIYPQLNPFTND